MRVEIGIRGRTGHITSGTPVPAVNNPDFLRWEQEDLWVFSWILQNLEPRLMNNVSDFQSAKALWDGCPGRDIWQWRKCSADLRYAQSSESTNPGILAAGRIQNNLQSLWLSIDRRRANPMKCDADLAEYNWITQENRLFNFLGGLDRRFDAVRREILRLDPLPSMEVGYAAVRKEAAMFWILALGSSDGGDP